jgi:hypothetical protein
MPKSVKLSKLVEEMTLQFDETTSYLERSTGELHMIRDEEMEVADGDDPLDEFPEWEQQAIEVARKILETDDFIALPRNEEIRPGEVVRLFCDSVKAKRVRQDLEKGLNGHGCLRRFEDLTREHGLYDNWRRFRDKALRKIALQWCRQNNIRYLDK